MNTYGRIPPAVSRLWLLSGGIETVRRHSVSRDIADVASFQIAYSHIDEWTIRAARGRRYDCGSSGNVIETGESP